MKRAVDYVNPLIDTANRRFFFMTTASRPFGMVNLSPDTRSGGDGWEAGYRYQDDVIHWFSHVHAWQLCGIPVLPTMGECRGELGPEGYKSRFSHEREEARAGYHRVFLDDYGIDAELTSTTRVGMHRYTFTKSGKPHVVIDLGAHIMLPMSDCFVRLSGPRELSGYVENDRTLRRPKRTKIFFTIQFDHEITGFSAWRDGNKAEFCSAMAGSGIGIAPEFQVESGEQLQMKVAISYCSSDNARRNLETELPHWDFDRVRAEAADHWNEMLGRIEVEGKDENKKIKFYTDLFHALKGRRIVSDADGSYMDMTGEVPQVRNIPCDETGKPLYNHHNSDAFWGAPWTLNLVWALAWPEITSSFCNTLVDMYRNGGLIPRGPSGGNYTYVMTSPSSTPFLVSAWQQGIRDFDIEAAYEGMVKNHGPGGLMSKAGYEHYSCKGGGVEYYLERGYVPLGIKAEALHAHAGATMTLEYAYHDWTLAQLAKGLGRDEDYKRFMQRSLSYRNVWDESTKFMRPRTMNGEFLAEFGHFDLQGWEEGNAHHYRWYVPHDPQALISLFGSDEEFVSELDKLFESAEHTNFVAPHGKHECTPLDYGNQPCMYIAHLFNYARRPDLAQKWVRRIFDAAKSDITPYGGYSGDEDQGQMGCLNVLFALGLFSVNGGCSTHPYYELTVPVFDRMTIQLSPKYHSGKTFTVECSGNGPGERYIHKAVFNGKELPGPWLDHAAVMAGGKLELTLGETPNAGWGRGEIPTP